MADELEIRRTLAEYCHRCDDGDFEGLVALFASDAVLVHGNVRASGHAEVRDFFVERQGLPVQRGKHLTMNTVVDVDGDHARALSDFLYIQLVGGDVMPGSSGRYRDDLVRLDGVWCFARRQILPMDVPAG
jgi:ketosteroid isomerase-like protein